MSGKAVTTTGDQPDLTACDREPIHIPGSIQPHGLLLVADAGTLAVIGGAGDIEGRIAADWLGRPLADLIGQDVTTALDGADLGPGATFALQPVAGMSDMFDAAVHRVGAMLVVELEPVREGDATSRTTLAWLDATAGQMDRTPTLIALCERAAVAFRELTGFDRVMIYRFLDDDAGTVVAESSAPGQSTFLHHHFPASDIPKQARQLYVRNRVRVIPDIFYTPAPLRPAGAGLATLDLSDVTLRSVSPIHIQYLKNMGIAASASVSIVMDGVLWGLIACHSESPRYISYDRRAAAKALAGGLARQIKAKEDAERYRERLRLRASEDAVTTQMGSDLNLSGARDGLREFLAADGFAVIGQDSVQSSGATPGEADLHAIGKWVREHPADGEIRSTSQLAADYPEAASFQDTASGLLAFTLPGDGTVLAWFRREQVEEVNWAGNPHKAVEHRPGEQLTPRASFESWTQTVHGFARAWSLEEVDAARRLRRTLFDARQNRRLRELNRELAATIADKEALLRQNDYLIKEVNHRVQNSLQLVASFLGMQAKSLDDPVARGHFAEAQSRLAAVAQVHRRLHQDDRVETVDLARYIEQLCTDISATMGVAANEAISLNVTPVRVSPDRAVNIGLVLTELVINASKYAYRGGSGPIDVTLEQHRNRFQLHVADRGAGKQEPGQGFGTRMMNAMVDRLDGTLSYEDNCPGLRAIVTAPIG